MGNLVHQVSFKVDEETFRRLSEVAAEENEAISGVARRLVQSALQPGEPAPTSPLITKQKKRHEHIRNENDEMIWHTCQRVAAIEKELQYIAMSLADAQSKQTDRDRDLRDWWQSQLRDLPLTPEPSSDANQAAVADVEQALGRVFDELRRTQASIGNLPARIETHVTRLPADYLRQEIRAMREDWIKSFAIILHKNLGFEMGDVKDWISARLSTPSER